MALFSITEIQRKAVAAFKRFPITLIWAIIGSLLCIIIIEGESNLFEDYGATLLTLILGVSWLIGTQFFMEQFKNPGKWVWLKGVTVLLLVLFYWHLPGFKDYNPNPMYFFRFFLYLIAGHLFVFFAPFVWQWNKEAFWNYLKMVCIAIGRSILFSGVLYLGLVLALMAIRYLFNVDIPDERYGQLFVFCLGIVNTWTYLSDFPKNVLAHTQINYNKALEVFVKYILIPLIMLYMVILYAYALKIVLQWDLPKGWVSYLVTALALLGFLVQVMVNPVQKTIASWSINRFYPWFYILLLPLVALLFVAIFKRIGDYGITENRYFVLVVSFWILGMALYMLLSKKKQLRVLPISLFILAMLGSFGAWGAFQVSKNSQVKQFEKVFEAVRKNKNLASSDQYDQLTSVLDYLNDRDAAFRLDGLLGISTEGIFKDTVTDHWIKYRYGKTAAILDTLHIKLDPKDLGKSGYNDRNHFNFYNDGAENQSLDISGFDHFATLDFNDYQTDKTSTIGKYTLLYDAKNKKLMLRQKNIDTVLLTIPIQKKLKSLMHLKGYSTATNREEFTMDTGTVRFRAKLIFTDLGFFGYKDSIGLNHARGFLFLKER